MLNYRTILYSFFCLIRYYPQSASSGLLLPFLLTTLQLLFPTVPVRVRTYRVTVCAGHTHTHTHTPTEYLPTETHSDIMRIIFHSNRSSDNKCIHKSHVGGTYLVCRRNYYIKINGIGIARAV